MFHASRTQNKKSHSLITPLLLISALTACGGGGGSGVGPVVVVPPPPANSAPRLVGDLSPMFPENSDVIFVLSVEDDDGDTVTVTIGNSNDGQFFTLDPNSGEIRGTQQFDFENPLDADQDSIYVQTVTLDDGTSTVNTEVRVIINNIDEAPTCDVTPATSVDENVSGLLATLSGSDPDVGDDAIAVFDNLGFSDDRLDGFVSVDSTTGAVNLDTPLNAEAFEPNFSFTVFANYRTNSLFDRCSVLVNLNDLPNRVTSGILFNDNLSDVKSLSDLNGDGLTDFWMADDPDPSGNGPVTGTLIFGQTFADALAADGAATIDVASLPVDDRLRISGTFVVGLGNATSVTVESISDLDGDDREDLLVISNLPPNDGLDPTRRPWGFVVFASTITNNVTGSLDLNGLAATEGFALTGPVDFNGGNASYVVADLDGVDGDEIAISLPESLGFGGESGQLYVVSGAALLAATGNLDFDLEPTTQLFEGLIDVDARPVIGSIEVIGDLDVDGTPELLMSSQQNVTVIPSTNLIGSGGGPIDVLNPLLLDLEDDFAGAVGQADVDGDNTADLLLVRGTGAPNTRQAGIVFGDALAPIVTSDSEVALNGTNFNPGDYVEFTSGGLGDGPEPVRLVGVGDLDGDGREEVAFSLLDNANFLPGSIYIIRGSALTDLSTIAFNVDTFTADQGTQLVGVPFLFTSLSTQLSLTPDIDGDGLQDFYLTSFEREAGDPASVAIIVKSSDVSAALSANEIEVDIEQLFFDETPESL